jgi:hypothetical protein
MTLTLTKVEAEQVVRFVFENSDRIGAGIALARDLRGNLRINLSK